MSRKKLNSQSPSSYMDSRRKIVYQVGAFAALIVAGLLILALFDLLTANWQTGSLFQDNFLVLIFKLHAGFAGVQETALDGLHLLDVSILILVGVLALALYPTLNRVSKAWSIVAASLPFLGLLLYFITGGIGRSGILAAGLIISIILLRGNIIGKYFASAGILGHICLLIADIGTAFSYASIFAIVMGIGYLIITIWYLLMAVKLFQLGK